MRHSGIGVVARDIMSVIFGSGLKQVAHCFSPFNPHLLLVSGCKRPIPSLRNLP